MSNLIAVFTGYMPDFSGIHHLALTVKDIDVSTEFYQRVFGFAPAGELSGDGLHRRLFALPGGTNLGLTEHTPTTAEAFTPFRPGMDHLGFAVKTRHELVSWAEHLTHNNIDHGGLVEAPYGVVLSFKDPDGIALEFFLST